MNGITNELWPGWETVGVLGTGGFGSVYEIRRNVFGRLEHAALKTIVILQYAGEIEEMRQEGYDNASITARFQSYLEDIVREYNLMAELKGCANVVYCDDLRYVQHEDGFGWDLYIKMELLTPLLRALPQQVPEDQVIQLGIDMCNALALCRSKNIVHRDIKPQNIFVSNMGDYKLGDFGIAKTTERTASGTKTGTYKFMAPEVYNNQPYGLSVDQYSLGLVLYWLLNERRSPFVPLPPTVPRPGDEEEARYRRMSGQPLPEPRYGSRELKKIVLKACAFNPADRFSTPEEMRSALQALQSPGGKKLFLEEDDDTDGTIGIFGGGRSHFSGGGNHDPEDDTDPVGGRTPGGQSGSGSGKTGDQTPKVDLDVRTTVELSREQAMQGCTVLVTLPHLGEKLQLQVPAGVQDGQILRITGKGKTNPALGLTGSLLVSVKIAPEKETVHKTETDISVYTLMLTEKEINNGTARSVMLPDGSMGSVSIPAGVRIGQELVLTAASANGGRKVKIIIAAPQKKEKPSRGKDWSSMSDEELRKHISQKGCWLQIILAIVSFVGGALVGVGVPALGFALWGLTAWLIIDAVRVTKNAKKAEEEYFRRRKQS